MWNRSSVLRNSEGLFAGRKAIQPGALVYSDPPFFSFFFSGGGVVSSPMFYFKKFFIVMTYMGKGSKKEWVYVDV